MNSCFDMSINFQLLGLKTNMITQYKPCELIPSYMFGRELPFLRRNSREIQKVLLPLNHMAVAANGAVCFYRNVVYADYLSHGLFV